MTHKKNVSTLKTISGIGTDLLKEIEAFMNSDKNEAVKKAVSKVTILFYSNCNYVTWLTNTISMLSSNCKNMFNYNLGSFLY